MTQEGYTDTTDATEESMDDSPIIKALRKQIRDLEKAVNAAPTRESIEAEVRGELARQAAISAQLIELGHPAGMWEAVKGRLGESEVTRDSVAEALRGIGYQVEVVEAPEESGGEASVNVSDLAKVTSLSAQVRSAAQGVDPGDVMRKINQATSPEDLQAILVEAGLAVSN